MARCGYRWDAQAGERYYLPQCWGGLYDISGCYCRPRSHDETDTDARLAAVEAKLDRLLAQATPPHPQEQQ